MTHVPQRKERYTEAHERTEAGRNPSRDVPLSDRDPDKVIYGPKGDVIKRIEDRPFLGYHRENGRSS
jgi:hypothetical protein